MRGSGRRALGPALAVLALVGVVAIAATGSTRGGSNETRRPPVVFFDTILSLFLLTLLAGAILFAYGLLHRKEAVMQYARLRRRRGSLAFLIATTAFVILVYFRARPSFRGGPGSTAERVGIPSPTNPSGSDNTGQYQPHFAWLPVLVILLLAAAAGLAAYAASRRQSRRERDEAVTETLAALLDDTLDDLRAESDPRRAVVAAYARLERALAVHGFPRRSSETQEEFLARILGLLDVGTASIERLTDLYTRAKFSHHEVNAEMKDEAIAALEEVRDELREAERRAVEGALETASVAGTA